MSSLPFGRGALIFIGCYLLFMLGLGYLAKRTRRSESLSDFYLAGKNLGGFVLLLTLYATQYSGNTLLGYPGEAYRRGFVWIMSVGFMIAIVVVYLLFAPRLYHQAKRFNYVTPGDWLDYRFGLPVLTATANLLMVIALSNYLLAQLMAMGHVAVGLSGNKMPYWVGVVFLSLIIIMYENMGGMRAVAWTDCIQGLMLLLGLLGMLIAVVPSPQHFRVATEWILSNQPQKVAVPTWELCRTWMSTILLVGFSGAVYPQAIQRIYAARNVRALKRSLSLLVFMPFITTLVVFFIGILGIQYFSDLKGITADQVMPMLLRKWSDQSMWMYAMAVLVVTGILAAIMSTADSVLLSLSSILTKDFLGKTVLKNSSEERLTQIGKRLSWLIVAILVVLAMVPRVTLWGLTELKMELLVQISPLFVLGSLWRRLTAKAAFVGMLAGAVLAVSLKFGGFAKLWGLHAGFLGWGLNLLLCMTLSFGKLKCR